MSFNYDLNTDVGKVRCLIGDTVSSTAVLQDEEIQTIITMNNGDLFLAAAQCLRRMAANKAILGKRITAGDYSEDTTSAAKGMLEVADALEKMALSTPADAQAEIIYTDFNYQTILRNKIYRGENINDG